MFVSFVIWFLMLGNLDGAAPDARELLKDQHSQRMIVVNTRNIGVPVLNAPQSDVWIGVRLTPIPDVLAAHIGADGLLLSNVAVGSPADEAGLKQFDVILSMNGNEIRTIEDVHTLLQSAKPNDNADLVLIREGRKRTRKLTLTARPDQVLGWKHDEPEMVIDGLGPQDQLNAGLLRLDPMGRLRMTPLGVLDDPGFALDDAMGPQWRKMLEEMDAIWLNPPAPDRFGALTQPVPDANTSIHITRMRNGERLEISREPGGPFVVERRGAAGDSVVEYADMDQLLSEDPEAYDALTGMSGARAPTILINPPQNQQQLDTLREKFMQEFQEYEKQRERNNQLPKGKRSALPSPLARGAA